MDKEALLGSLANTLNADHNVRKQSEEKLKAYEELPGFTAYLLELITDRDVSFGVQVSAAIFFKNRVSNYWVVPDLKAATPRYVQQNEKSQIKSKLVEVLSKTYKNTQLRVQLTTAISSILDAEKWDEIVPVIEHLLNDTGNIDHVFTGLLCLFQYTKCYRYAGIDSEKSKNIVLNEIVDKTFPSLERLTDSLLQNESAQSDEMLYLILKTFRYSTIANLPPYLEDLSNLGKWCQSFLYLIDKPLPNYVLSVDPSERATLPRIKAVKWCFGDILNLLWRHGGGVSTKNKKSAFAVSFVNDFVPQILSTYWTIIEKWATEQIWLSQPSLYNMISFLEQIVETSAFSLIGDKIEAIVSHVLLPILSASQQTIEMYEDEPEEYIRRFFDVGKENSTADTASINFLYRLSTLKFSSCGAPILNIINAIFQKRAADRNDVKVACETEGALRILATISYRLDKKNSPVKGQIDQLLHSVVYPELSEATISKTPWLAARACDTIAIFMHKFTDQNVLQDIFHGVVSCFQQQEHFPIQLTAIDALRTLVEEPYVANQIAQQAPQLMGTLLDMSKNFESDILTSVMDVFVEKFAANLEPYAVELSYRLVEQFLTLAHQILEQSSNGGSIDVDQEYQAAGILNTLGSLVISMNSSEEVAASLEATVKSVIIFILQNSMALFLCEAMEMAESLLFGTGKMSSSLWEIYHEVISAFDTYAFDYFDTFHPFLEAVVSSAFSSNEVTMESPDVQNLFRISFQILGGDDVDPVFANLAFELLEFSILSLGHKFGSFLPNFLPQIFSVFTALDSQDAFDGFMLHHLSILRIFFACLHVNPSYTLQYLNEQNFTNLFYKLWLKHSDDFQSVYGCKLQVLASISIVIDSELGLINEDLLGETVNVLISNLETLPHAIRARQELLDRESGVRPNKDFESGKDDDEDNDDNEFYDEDLEADEAELEALKQTPIDSINVYAVFADKTTAIQHSDANRYQIVFGNLDESQKEIAMRIININQQQKNAAALS